MSIDIKTSDFSNFRLCMLVKNVTSATDFLTPDDIIIDELLDEGLKLRVPNQIGASGHTLMVIFLNDGFKDIPDKLPADGDINDGGLVAIGKVLEMEKDGDNGCVYLIKFNQFNAEEWASINNRFREKQEEIVQLFEQIRYEQTNGN